MRELAITHTSAIAVHRIVQPKQLNLSRRRETEHSRSGPQQRTAKTAKEHTKKTKALPSISTPGLSDFPSISVFKIEGRRMDSIALPFPSFSMAFAAETEPLSRYFAC